MEEREYRRRNGNGLLAFGVMFLLAGLGFGYFAFLKPIAETFAAQRWAEVPCTILTSRVASFRGHRGRGGAGTTYAVEVTYRYRVGGVDYIGERYNRFSVSSSGRGDKAAIVRAFPPGLETVCRVNPEDPADSCLRAELGRECWLGLIPLAFFGFGGVALGYGVRQRSGRAK